MTKGPLHDKWDATGPFSADGNALDHLRRYGFEISRGLIITPPRGYELNREDWSAIDYLVKEWDYSYAPGIDAIRDVLQERLPGSRAPASKS